MPNALTPMGLLEMLIAQLVRDDASPEGPTIETEDDDDGDAPEPAIVHVRSRRVPLQVIDARAKAAKAVYRKTGKNKRTLYPPVVLSKRQVYIALHQMGVDLPPSWRSYWKVSAHYVVRTDGVVVRNHDLDVQLITTNRYNRAPYHAIAIEFAGNFEGDYKQGNFWHPETNGRTVLSEVQADAGVQLCLAISDELSQQGVALAGILPHRIAGRDERGKPNRGGCPGWEIWSQVGEPAAWLLDAPIPGDGFRKGGLSIPHDWHNPDYDDLARFYR